MEDTEFNKQHLFHTTVSWQTGMLQELRRENSLLNTDWLPALFEAAMPE